jgi:hypothetical protein
MPLFPREGDVGIVRDGEDHVAHVSRLLGVAVLGNALMTDYPLGVFRLYPFKVHGILDYGVAAASAGLPALLDIDDSTSSNISTGKAPARPRSRESPITNDNSGSRRYRWELES